MGATVCLYMHGHNARSSCAHMHLLAHSCAHRCAHTFTYCMLTLAHANMHAHSSCMCRRVHTLIPMCTRVLTQCLHAHVCTCSPVNACAHTCSSRRRCSTQWLTGSWLHSQGFLETLFLASSSYLNQCSVCFRTCLLLSPPLVSPSAILPTTFWLLLLV